MDVPHHWEGWVVGEGLGSLSHDGDADCPVDIFVFSQAFFLLCDLKCPIGIPWIWMGRGGWG